MVILIEVFRNVFAGKGCLTLTKNVLDYVCDKQGDFDVRLITVSSDVAKERGITKAPAIMINKKVSAVGVSSVEEIEKLIEQAKPKNMGILLSKSPFESEDAKLAFRIAIEALDLGDSVDVFLMGDGVWTAKTDLLGEMGTMLNKFIEKNGKLMVSAPHLKAGGLSQDRIEKTAEVLDKPYDILVDLIMTKWDKVVTF
jgi:sulfur relay protein TusB/DsrH